MNITLERKNDAFHFQGLNDSGCTVDIDAAPKVGGLKLGVQPMQLLLMCLGGCSGIDVVAILNKQKQVITSFQISIDGERQQEAIPALFESIELHFQLEGDVDPAKAKRAVSLSVEKYCPVAESLRPPAEINWRVSVNGEAV